MSRVTDGTFAEGINAFVTKPQDILDRVDLSKAVNLNVTSLDDMSLDVGGLVNLTYHNGELNFDTGYRSPKETALQWVEEQLSSIAGDYEGVLSEETDFFSLENNIDFKTLQDAYDNIAQNDIKRDVTEWAMSQVDAVAMRGDISTIGDISETFGRDTLLSYFPAIVGDTLKNWSIEEYIPNLTFTQYPEYVSNEFLPLLDGIDTYWDKFTQFGVGDTANVIPDLSVFIKSNPDVQRLFTMHDRTQISSLIGSSQTIRDVDTLVSIYRPYLQ